MLFELVTFFIGIAFGYFHAGKEDYTSILWRGAAIGTVVGIVSVLASYYLIPGSTSLSFDFLGAFGIILVIVLFVIILIAGAFVGDQAERLLRK